MKECAQCGRQWVADRMSCAGCGCPDFVNPTPPPFAPPPSDDPRAAAVLDGGGRTHTLARSTECVLGRDESSPLAEYFRLYPNVSVIHATVRVENGPLLLIDHASRNGTWLDEVRLDAGREHRIPLPARIRLGSNCFLLVSEPGVAPGSDR